MGWTGGRDTVSMEEMGLFGEWRGRRAARERAMGVESNVTSRGGVEGRTESSCE